MVCVPRLEREAASSGAQCTGWHRLSPGAPSGTLGSAQRASAEQVGSFEGDVTKNSGIMAGDSGHKPKIGDKQAEKKVSFIRNESSRCSGIRRPR